MSTSRLDAIRASAESKFNLEGWMKATQAETWIGEGCETVTGTSGKALVKQAGPKAGQKVLDIGSGMGQVTQALMELNAEGLEVLAGDVDDSFLEVVGIKKEERGWKNVETRKLNVLKLDLPDNTFDHVFANFVYFLTPDPIQGLKESIRVLKPGGTLGFTTWAHNEAIYFLQHAAVYVPEAPNIRTEKAAERLFKSGYWHDRQFIRSTLEDLGLEDIRIEVSDYRLDQPVSDKFKGAWPVMKIFTMGWGEKQKELGWEMFEHAMGDVVKGSRDQEVYSMRFVSLVITAFKPKV